MFGDGSGDVRKFVIEPTERLLNILNTRQITMTVFFELEEFLVFRKYANELKNHLGYDPVLLIEEQLKRMVHTGHEIGLHLHPQWIGGGFDGKGFKLSQENQCLFDVYKSEKQMRSYLSNRVNILRTLVRKCAPSYEVICFRAGGLALRPEKVTLNVLQSLGVKADSSVVAGLYRIGKGTNIDYRDAPYNKGFWNVSDNVCKLDSNGKIIEFPIYSKMKPAYRKLSINRIKRKFFSGLPVTARSQGFSEMALPKTPCALINHLFKKAPLKFDYCHMTSQEMLSFLYDAHRENRDGTIYPLTIMGHTKEFFNDKHFSLFLDAAVALPRVEFMTMGEMVIRIERRGI